MIIDTDNLTISDLVKLTQEHGAEGAATLLENLPVTTDEGECEKQNSQELPLSDTLAQRAALCSAILKPAREELKLLTGDLTDQWLRSGSSLPEREDIVVCGAKVGTLHRNKNDHKYLVEDAEAFSTWLECHAEWGTTVYEVKDPKNLMLSIFALERERKAPRLELIDEFFVDHPVPNEEFEAKVLSDGRNMIIPDEGEVVDGIVPARPYVYIEPADSATIKRAFSSWSKAQIFEALGLVEYEHQTSL